MTIKESVQEAVNKSRRSGRNIFHDVSDGPRKLGKVTCLGDVKFEHGIRPLLKAIVLEELAKVMD